MALYGWALFNGVGIHANEERALQLLQQSKHVISRAYCSLRGFGVDEDEGEGYRLLSTECDTSDPHVQFLLGQCCECGWGCKDDYEAQIVQCYERAGNHIDALNRLSVRLNYRADHTANCRGIEFCRQAATQGDSAAQFRLGCWYQRGRPGVLKKDIAQAKHWYSLAAEQDHQRAAIALEQERLNK
eukprot:TRINITY_DN5449_c0_g4_i1.p1 TRINITY_DN5449_c0_g4~~TRINITY_DN5449_c0_g4_i1.p1  ORF type:complete len:200 (-),score=40.77 TRINITY_DN5449_c0_g4_i1:98-655(-)